MSTFAKIMVVVNLLLAIAFLATAGTLHGAAESWKGKHADVSRQLNQQIEALQGQVQARQQEADQARAERETYHARMEAAEAVQKQLVESSGVLQRELESKNAEITRLQQNITDQTGAIGTLTQRTEQLTNQLATSEGDRKQALERVTTLEENLARETARADSAEKSTAAAEATNKSQAEALDAAQTELAVYKAQRGPLSVGAVVKPVKGVVQAAKPADDVYVISVGSKDEVKVGYEFTVSRGDKYVSTIVIDSVYPNNAAGRTKPGMKKLEIQPGDTVSTATGL